MKSKHTFEKQYDILQYSLTENYIFQEKSTADKKVLDKGVWGQHDLVFRQPWLSTISWNTKSDHRQYPRNATTGFLCLKYHHGNTAEASVFHQHLSNPFIHKGWGQSAKLGKHSAIWGKLGTALQAYTLNPCAKFAANPTSGKVNT